MPVIQFTRDVGRKWTKGQIVNLPTTTLKAMAKSDGVDDYKKFSKVMAVGADCVPFMAEYQKTARVESVHPRRGAAPSKKRSARGRLARLRKSKEVSFWTRQ